MGASTGYDVEAGRDERCCSGGKATTTNVYACIAMWVWDLLSRAVQASRSQQTAWFGLDPLPAGTFWRAGNPPKMTYMLSGAVDSSRCAGPAAVTSKSVTAAAVQEPVRGRAPCLCARCKPCKLSQIVLQSVSALDVTFN